MNQRFKRYLILGLFILVFSGLLTFMVHPERFFLLAGQIFLSAIFLGGIMPAYEGCLMYKSEYGFYIRPFSQPKKNRTDWQTCSPSRNRVYHSRICLWRSITNTFDNCLFCVLKPVSPLSQFWNTFSRV